MVHHATRVIAALLALLGLVLTAGGAWLATQLGPQGTATFRSSTMPGGTVLVTPGVINRLDADFVITAVPKSSTGTVWLASASPADADQILGESPVTRIVGMSVRDGWVLRQLTAGSGEPPALVNADIWREVQTGAGPQTITITQENAPEAVLIRADGTDLKELRVTVERRAWFVQALVLAVVGVALLLAGLLLWRSRLGSGRVGQGKDTDKGQDQGRVKDKGQGERSKGMSAVPTAQDEADAGQAGRTPAPEVPRPSDAERSPSLRAKDSPEHDVERAAEAAGQQAADGDGPRAVDVDGHQEEGR